MIKRCSFAKSVMFLFAGLVACGILHAQQSKQNDNSAPPQASPKQSTNLFFGLLVFNIWDTQPNDAQQAKSSNANREKEATPSKHPLRGNASRTRQKQAIAAKKSMGNRSSQYAASGRKKSDSASVRVKTAPKDLFARADNPKQNVPTAAPQIAAPQQTYTYASATPAVASTDQYLQAEKKSLRRDNILEDEVADSLAMPLPYTPLFAAEALYRARVWRVLDTKKSPNALYFYAPSIDEESRMRFINIIISAMQKDGVQAFSAVDDRFTTPLTFEQALAAFGGVSIDSIYKYQIKEEWVFNSRDGKSYVRILGIAPLITTYNANGGYVETPAFWIYYPDLRQSLVRNIIPDPLTGGSLTWEAVFERRLFTSRILRSTLDAQNGFTNAPLTEEQGAVIQDELNNLGKQTWAQQANANN